MVSKPRRVWLWIVGGAALLALVIGVVHGGRGRFTARTPATAARAHAPANAIPPGGARQPAPAPLPAPPTGPLTSFEDGTYRVGTAAREVSAGRYRSAGPTEGMPCYWARTKDSTGKVDAIIAQGYPDGPTTVTIKHSDRAFVTSGCARWSKIG